jgi:hypothetical protein
LSSHPYNYGLCNIAQPRQPTCLNWAKFHYGSVLTNRPVGSPEPPGFSCPGSRHCFSQRLSTSPAEYGAGLELAIERGWLWMHESGTYVKLTEAGAALFA